MMEELKKLPPLSPVEEPNRLITRMRRKQLQLQQNPPVRLRNLKKNYIFIIFFDSLAD